MVDFIFLGSVEVTNINWNKTLKLNLFQNAQNYINKYEIKWFNFQMMFIEGL